MSEQRLRPARFETGGKKPEYGPRLPWKWIVAVGGVVVLGGGGYWVQQQREAEALRAGILAAYGEQVGPAAERVQRFRTRIEKWTLAAAAEPPAEDWADPRLKLSGLHNAQGVYLRLEAAHAQTREGIAEGALEMAPDAITRCLGLTPVSLRTLYTRGEFLTDAWLGRVREAEGKMRLRVLEDELRRHLERDLPMLVHLLQSDYFLLVIQQGDNRRDHPVDVYLWDLRRGEPLLRTRTEPKGLLLPVRIAMGDAPRPPGRPKLDSGGANDCSIAAQVKELAGEPALTVGEDTGEVLEQAREPRAPDGGAAAGDGGTTPPETPGETPSAPDTPATKKPPRGGERPSSTEQDGTAAAT